MAREEMPDLSPDRRVPTRRRDGPPPSSTTRWRPASARARRQRSSATSDRQRPRWVVRADPSVETSNGGRAPVDVDRVEAAVLLAGAGQRDHGSRVGPADVRDRGVPEVQRPQADGSGRAVSLSRTTTPIQSCSRPAGPATTATLAPSRDRLNARIGPMSCSCGRSTWAAWPSSVTSRTSRPSRTVHDLAGCQIPRSAGSARLRRRSSAATRSADEQHLAARRGPPDDGDATSRRRRSRPRRHRTSCARPVRPAPRPWSSRPRRRGRSSPMRSRSGRPDRSHCQSLSC